MKILHFIDSLRIGGSENQTVEVAKRQAGLGHTVVVGCIRLEGPLAENLRGNNVSCREFPVRGGIATLSGLRQIIGLTSYIRRERFDVVHAHDVYANLMAVPAAWLARTPRILSSRRDLGNWSWHTPRNRAILRATQRLSDVIIANSQAVKAYLINSDGFGADKIAVVRNAVDVAKFADVSLAPASLPDGDCVDFQFAVVANMHGPTKGHVFLIAAAEQVCRQHPGVRFVLVGDGELRASLQDSVRSLGLQTNFLFVGGRTDVANILRAVDAGILPSLSEGLPNSVLEYMAAGKPIVATNVGGIPELIDDGTTGLLVAPGDSKGLAAAIESILHHRDLAVQFGAAARQKAIAEFSFDKLLSTLDRLYQSRNR